MADQRQQATDRGVEDDNNVDDAATDGWGSRRRQRRSTARRRRCGCSTASEGDRLGTAAGRSDDVQGRRDLQRRGGGWGANAEVALDVDDGDDAGAEQGERDMGADGTHPRGNDGNIGKNLEKKCDINPKKQPEDRLGRDPKLTVCHRF
ncbi:hypothetical protein E2562_030834 [Oryza meyeriana var. granulata]|uniref:Uncharacterized protein n=1 Tax=Oryza meyeriana var. granulata TaxID=110450 RepID=A0A6G1EZW2_9ORYZ|nr:hypothetical protein E2562_030834 [Oryza meyeriana var. granulata]